MSIKSGIRAKLIADAGIYALVGERVYPRLRPQESSLPAITYRRVSRAGMMTHDGPDRPESRFNLTCWATTGDGADSLAEFVRVLLDGTADQTWDDVTMFTCFLADQADVDEIIPETGELTAFGVELAFDIAYDE